MAARYYSLVLALLLVLRRAAPEPSCVYRDGERQCALPSTPQRLLLHEDKLVVGAIDYVYLFSPDLSYLDSGDISASASREERCVVFEAPRPALCRNFVRVVQPVNNESTILVCGTNAFFPKCRFHQLGNLSAWNYMTSEEHKDVGFSPHTNNTNLAVLASNGRFFTATFFKFRHIQQTIGMAPRLLEGDGTFTVETPSSNPQCINDPVFVSAYEVGEYIYFFAREPAYEVAGVEYSRVIRVCKNDSGFRLFPGDETLTFRTFQKARLRCRVGSQDRSVIPYDYDRLQATFLLQPSDGEPTLYGTFSSPVNGPEGAALCKFSFSSLESVFEDGQYWVFDKPGWSLSSPGSFACPGQPGSQRTEDQARTHQLMHNVVSATEPQPMHTVSGDEITHVAVDVVEYGGDALEVIVLGQRSGLVMLVVRYRGNTYKNTLRTEKNVITTILLHINPLNKERQVIFTTKNTVKSFSMGKCSLYSSCFACFDSHDPYCAWNQTTVSCVNKLTSSAATPALPDSLTSSEYTVTNICGSRPASTPQPRPVDPSTCPHTPTYTPEPSPGPKDSDVSTVGIDQQAEGKGENVGLLAGATVGGFLFGIPVGLVVCYLFFSVFLKKNSSKSQEPTTQSSRTILHINHNQLQGLSGFEKQPIANSSHYMGRTQVVHRNPATNCKNVNEVDVGEEEEEDDVLTDLPLSKSIPQSNIRLHPQRAVARHFVPRGRTESTRSRCLRASESSDWESSLSPVSSPV